MRRLTEDETIRAVQLLDIIVRPGDDEELGSMLSAITEAKKILGYSAPATRPRRSFYGIHKPKAKI